MFRSLPVLETTQILHKYSYTLANKQTIWGPFRIWARPDDIKRLFPWCSYWTIQKYFSFLMLTVLHIKYCTLKGCLAIDQFWSESLKLGTAKNPKKFLFVIASSHENPQRMIIHQSFFLKYFDSDRGHSQQFIPKISLISGLVKVSFTKDSSFQEYLCFKLQ